MAGAAPFLGVMYGYAAEEMIGRNELFEKPPWDLVEHDDVGVQPTQDVFFAPDARIEDGEALVAEADGIPPVADAAFQAGDLELRDRPLGCLARLHIYV